jgi:hypothetical protein
MRLSLLLAGSVVFVATACNFGDADVKKPATDDPYAERTRYSNPDTIGEKTLKGGSLTTIACGYEISCEPGTGCCVTANGPRCSNDCSTGRLFECDSDNDCGSGQTCCLEDNHATCSSSCGGVHLCNDGAQCGAGATCTEQRCDGRGFGACFRDGQEGHQIACLGGGEIAESIGTQPATPDPPIPK